MQMRSEPLLPHVSVSSRVQVPLVRKAPEQVEPGAIPQIALHISFIPGRSTTNSQVVSLFAQAS